MTALGLIITPPRLGDTVFCLPGLQWLQRCRADVHWHILALSPLSAEVFNHHPFFKQVFIASINTHKRWYRSEKRLTLPEEFSFEPYQHVLAMDYNTGCMPQFIPFAGPHWQRISVRPANIHQAAYTLQFIEAFCQQSAPVDMQQYAIYPSTQDRALIEQLLTHHAVQDTQALVVLHMGCHGLKKQRRVFRRKFDHHKAWPLAHWLSFAKALRGRHNHVRFVLTGTLAEAHLAEVFMKQFPDTINVIAQTNIQQLAALFDKARLFITGDTGPLHIACSTSVPLIALFGPTDFATTGPFPLNARRLCVSHDDLAMITPSQIVEMAEPWLTDAIRVSAMA